MIKKAKRGFSLLVAIFVIVMLSLVAAYIFYAATHIAKEGQIQYQREQAILLARSYTEYAVMAIEGHDRDATNNCLTKIDANIGTPHNGQGYKIEVRIRYIGNNKYINMCNSSDIVANLSDTKEDTLFAIIDVYVKYKDILHRNIGTVYESYIPWQTYHKRSIQKI